MPIVFPGMTLRIRLAAATATPSYSLLASAVADDGAAANVAGSCEDAQPLKSNEVKGTLWGRFTPQSRRATSRRPDRFLTPRVSSATRGSFQALARRDRSA